MADHQSGRLESAEQAYRKVLQADPRQPDALQLFGILMEQRGESLEAERLMRASLQVQPAQPVVWSNLAHLLWKLDRLEEAEECTRRALELDPCQAAAYLHLGNIFARRATQDQNLLLPGLPPPPDWPTAGRLAPEIKEPCSCRELARRAYQRTIDLQPRQADAHNNLGNIYHQLHQSEEAIAHYRQALQLQPRYLEAGLNLAKALEDLGRLAEAEQLLQQLRSQYPANTILLRQLSHLRRIVPADGLLEPMERMWADSNLNTTARMHLGFALGKVQDDLGNTIAAFEYYSVANRLKRSSYTFQLSDADAYLSTLQQAFVNFYKNHSSRQPAPLPVQETISASDPPVIPVFIIGMPRSGTTLVEQILAAHSQVAAGGELDHLRQVCIEGVRRLTGQSLPQALGRLTPEQFTLLREAYLQLLHHHAAGRRYVTDKLPGNFQFAGLIPVLFPEARIIHCQRDPLDTCWSIYKNYFTGYQPFAYDLAELGGFYGLYRRLMRFWKDQFGDLIHEISYEQLTVDQEAQTRRLLDFCGLNWEDSCLQFHQARTVVRTASSAQVRQPLYRTSVAAWQRYAGHLGELIQALPIELRSQ
ncbi:MAG: Lipopolysaccharide assembly protein B [Phycisphaerae bacterium]|nr:Lipopolysaccharide assembly protein B [Phycisphaerae bacterium]